MRVRITQSIASPDWAYRPGQMVDMEPEQAETWISSGLATPAEETPARVPNKKRGK